jgi:protein SCO1/2
MRPRNLFLVVLLPLLLGLSAPTLADVSTRSESSTRKGGTRWGAEYFPNVPLITHEGKEVRFFDDLIKDKVVAINFIYTSCPDSCSLETARMVNVQRILGDRVGKDVFMYSISIDPETDTPEVLRDYVERFHVAPGWTFLTGTEEDIVLLRQKLGLYIDEIQEEDSNDHNLSLIIGNQSTGRWMKRSPFENPHYLAAQMGSWLHNWKLPDPNSDNYANAPELRQLSTGESLFRTRCAACHTIGEGDIMRTGQLLGPDLLGVTKRRDPAWLSRWLYEPEKMLQEKDPIAMGLYVKFNNMPMPNMRLNPAEVGSVIEFLESESRRVEAARALASSWPAAD